MDGPTRHVEHVSGLEHGVDERQPQRGTIQVTAAAAGEFNCGCIHTPSLAALQLQHKGLDVVLRAHIAHGEHRKESEDRSLARKRKNQGKVTVYMVRRQALSALWREIGAASNKRKKLALQTPYQMPELRINVLWREPLCREPLCEQPLRHFRRHAADQVSVATDAFVISRPVHVVSMTDFALLDPAEEALVRHSERGIKVVCVAALHQQRRPLPVLVKEACHGYVSAQQPLECTDSVKAGRPNFIDGGTPLLSPALVSLGFTALGRWCHAAAEHRATTGSA